MLVFHRYYFLLAVVLFIAEILIGTYMHDAVIRPYGGDFLVVILLYCFIKSFINLPVKLAAAWVLLFAYMVEVSQYFHLVKILGLQHSNIARIMLGTSFSFTDLLCYALGVALVLLVEYTRNSFKKE